MPEWNEMDLTERELQLAQEFEELAPVMRAASRSRDEEPNPAFLTALRSRLVALEPVAPDAGFERRLRERLVGRRPRISWQLGALGSAAVAAVLVLLLVLRPGGSTAPKQRYSAAGIPQPGQQDLTRGYPLSAALVGGGGGGFVSPLTSLTQGPVGAPYRGRLHLTFGMTFPTLARVTAYRLASSPFGGTSLVRTAQRLGMRSRPICMNTISLRPATCGDQTWRVVGEHLSVPGPRVHSLAVSHIGETVFHDLTFSRYPEPGVTLSRRRAVAFARAWLRSVGWPEGSAPVLAVTPVKNAQTVSADSSISVTFGWNDGVPATPPAATLWIAPSGRVIEAHLWPPIVDKRPVSPRAIDDAWKDVATGSVPIDVLGAGFIQPAGAGTVTGVEMVQILVTPAHAPAYLEPVYRFTGTVHLGNGQGTHTWTALVPAIDRG